MAVVQNVQNKTFKTASCSGLGSMGVVSKSKHKSTDTIPSLNSLMFTSTCDDLDDHHDVESVCSDAGSADENVTVGNHKEIGEQEENDCAVNSCSIGALAPILESELDDAGSEGSGAQQLSSRNQVGDGAGDQQVVRTLTKQVTALASDAVIQLAALDWDCDTESVWEAIDTAWMAIDAAREEVRTAKTQVLTERPMFARAWDALSTAQKILASELAKARASAGIAVENNQEEINHVVAPATENSPEPARLDIVAALSKELSEQVSYAVDLYQISGGVADLDDVWKEIDAGWNSIDEVSPNNPDVLAAAQNQLRVVHARVAAAYASLLLNGAAAPAQGGA